MLSDRLNYLGNRAPFANKWLGVGGAEANT